MMMENANLSDRRQQGIVDNYYEVVLGTLKGYRPLGVTTERKKGAIEQYLFYETWLIEALNEDLPRRIRASKGIIVLPDSKERSGDCDVIIYKPQARHQAGDIAVVDSSKVVAEIEVIPQMKEPSQEDLDRYDEELRHLTGNLAVIGYFGNPERKREWERHNVRAFLLSSGYPKYQKPIVSGEYERLLSWLSSLPEGR